MLLAVWIDGGGIQPGYEADIPFNGKTYPTYPSVPPARRLAKEAVGQIVVPRDMEAVPLY